MNSRFALVAPAALMAALTSVAFGAADLPFVQQARELAAAHPDVVQTIDLGASRHGRALMALRLAAAGEAGSAAPQDRPAIVIVAGLDGRHLIGPEVALGLAGKLIDEHADVLKQNTVYVVPAANPDSLAWNLDKSHPSADFGRTLAPYDADHDGRVDEDPGEDLDGDGAILTMRVKNPAPGSGLKAEYMIDPDNPRLLKKADAAKGEKAEYALLVEGIDNDGDGKFNEDGIGGTGGGGVDLNMNFPYRWPEFVDGAGKYQLSEPESLALTKWMLSLDNVAAVLTFGPGDTLINLPQAGKFDPTGQVPLGIEDGDKAYYEEVSKLFKDATRQTGAPTTDNAGSFEGWAYADYGAFSFQTPVWVRPDLVKKEEAKKDGEKKEEEKKEDAPPPKAPEARPGGAEGDRPAPPSDRPPRGGGTGGGGAGRPGGAGQPGGAGRGPRRGGGGRGGPPGGGGPSGGAEPKKPGEPDTDDAKWLKYSDDLVAGGGAAGFVDWHAFKHPQLGDVEIGGFLPGFKLNPPASETARLVEEQTKFVVALASKLPRVRAEAPVVERLGPDLWRLTLRVVNDGYLPSMPAIGAKARRALPTLVTFGLPLDRIVAGEKVNRMWSIPGSGGQFDSQWTITGSEGDAVPIDFRPSVGAREKISVVLKDGGK
jgi:Zinc carboxypeptidase